MDENFRIHFDEILKKSEEDRKRYAEYHSEENWDGQSSPEWEEEVLERMFLVYYVKKYIEYKEALEQIANATDLRRFASVADMNREFFRIAREVLKENEDVK